MPQPRGKWLTRKEAADLLDTLGCPVSPNRLIRLGTIGNGPPFVRSRGKTVRYHVDALRTWAMANIEHVA